VEKVDEDERAAGGSATFEEVIYYVQRDDPSDVRVAVYRMRKRTGSSWQAHYWDWRAGNWHESEDIIRRYWNGFDPDVDRVTEEEAVEAIKRRSKE
jgi:hypothetical protein